MKSSIWVNIENELTYFGTILAQLAYLDPYLVTIVHEHGELVLDYYCMPFLMFLIV